MKNIFLFLKESDSEAIRRSHRRRARELAAEMSQPASVTRKVMSMTVRSGPAHRGLKFQIGWTNRRIHY